MFEESTFFRLYTTSQPILTVVGSVLFLVSTTFCDLSLFDGVLLSTEKTVEKQAYLWYNQQDYAPLPCGPCAADAVSRREGAEGG